MTAGAPTAGGPGPDETLDRLCGDWHILQLAKGHRFSTDDLVVAWAAGRARPDARRLLDLGAGVGSVGLMTLFQMGDEAHLTMVEAQAVSHALARRSVHLNGLGPRVTPRFGDLRDAASILEDEHGSFDLVTGSPPYIPIGSGKISPHPQRAHCRMELRGDVFDYCTAAARALHPSGAFVLVHSAVDARPEAAIHAAGLTLWSRQDVRFRRNRAPTIAVWTCGFGGDRSDPPDLVVREADGVWSTEWQALREQLGAPRFTPIRAPR